ncbi:Shedu anti-phage system protein SduA domain-containing protein [Flavobacterium sp. RHBU_24]|uniref:Shedu anti-phage system protein SduA domain-containing protein n=1 Tax=Flavobacterium sp. RHBU_24 TaxID=3391185 RepID=UPI0039854C3B
MSVPFHKEIFSNDKVRLFINYGGIDDTNTTNKENISLSIYAVNIKTLEPVFSEKLNFEQIKTLYNHLNSVSIISGESYTTSEFTEITDDIAEIMSMIKHIDVKSLKSLFEKIDHNEKIDLLLKALTENEIQNLHATIRQNNHRKALTNLAQLLDLEEKHNIIDEIKFHTNLIEYKAGQPEKIFQNWIEHNLWTLGIDYVKKHPARLISLESESDLIMETTDGFIDLIELKRPNLKLFKYDLSHKSYFPSVDLSKALGQCLLYLKALDEYKLNLERTHKFRLLRPRIKIIIGRSKSFSDEEYEALRMLNSTLNHIQIITYDYLHMCGENIISYYSEEIDKVIKHNDIVTLSTMS